MGGIFNKILFMGLTIFKGKSIPMKKETANWSPKSGTMKFVNVMPIKNKTCFSIKLICMEKLKYLIYHILNMPKATAQLSSKYLIRIPKAIIEKLGLKPGDIIVFDYNGKVVMEKLIIK
jgi:AbrB family looped-hinge helix DNA binding protein